jgi:hypothetical protein
MLSRGSIALACGILSAACSPAELSGSDRVEGGIVDSGAPLDVSLDGDATSTRDASSPSDGATTGDTSEPDAKDAAPEDGDGGCPPATTAGDFYVAPSGDAEACNTFSTIAEALQAARSSTAAQRTLHLAPGLYSDPALFPIDLRGGISLVGSGAGSSVLEGCGLATTISPPVNSWVHLSTSDVVSATILTGDPVKTSQISGVTIEPCGTIDPTLGVMAGSEAIVCDRGNAATTPPSPNTLLSHVEITGFEVGVRVTWSGPPLSGCNLSLTSSTVENGWYGVVADGDDLVDGPAQTVSVQVGNLTGGGNRFVNLGIPTSAPQDLLFGGAGLATCDAVTGVVVAGNHFLQQLGAQGDWGVLAIHNGSYESPGFHIEGNDLGPLTQGGVLLWGAVVVDQLLDNSVHDCSMVPGWGWGAVGLAWGADEPGYPFPLSVVRRARGNSFVGNDIGVSIRSGAASIPPTPSNLSSDFGTAADPGQNTFRCNSVPSALGTVQGSGDVFVLVESALQPPVTIPFEGNVWDHAPPTMTIGSDLSPAPGMDIAIVGDAGAALPLSVDVADASAASMAVCPAGRGPGP